MPQGNKLLTKDELQHLYRYSYGLTCNEADAYDLLQTSLEKYLSTKKEISKAIPFIKKIIKNSHIDQFRHNKIIEFDDYDDNVFPLNYDAKDLESIIINEDMVESIFSYLTLDEREIIFYWAYEGYTAQQISDALEIPRGTILSKLHRIKLRLVKQFNFDEDVTSENAAEDSI